MSKRHRNHRKAPAEAPAAVRRNSAKAWLIVAVVLVAGAALALLQNERGKSRASSTNSAAAASTASNTVVAAPLPTNEVAHALMVTVELDFGGKPPSIKDALREVERRYQPESGSERTFAILDAYGEVTPDGKLHMSMHLSMEKPGIGSLIFKRTGEVLWKSKIVASGSPPGPKNLTVLIDDNAGHSGMLDGSKGIGRVLDVPLHNSTSLVRDTWPDGEEREFTFLYGACGCPVKAKVRRTGETTARATELPVMFPDDPAAMEVISKLMGWPVNP